MPLVTYLDSADGIGIYVSPQVEEILEVAVEEWVGSYAAWLDRVHPDDRDDVDRRYRAMLTGGDNFDLEYRVVRRDGSLRWMHDQGRRMTEPAAVAGLIQGVIYDVTDRHRAEQAAERRAGQQRMLAELGLRALSGVDRLRLVRDATEAAAETLGVWAAAVLEPTADGRDVEIVAGPARWGAPSGPAARPAMPPRQVHLHVRGAADQRRPGAGDPVPGAGRGAAGGDAQPDCVKIAGTPAPYGVLAVYSTEARAFTEDAVDYLQATANILATAVERDRAQAALDGQRGAAPACARRAAALGRRGEGADRDRAA